MRALTKWIGDRLRHSSFKKQNKRNALSRSIRFESLEDRRLMAITSTYMAGTNTLQIDSDTASDTVTIGTVFDSGINALAVTINGNTVMSGGSAVAAGGLQHLKVYGNVGNDTLDLSAVNSPQFNAALNVVIDGGAGTDTIRGSQLADRITGGTGNDSLIGNAGNDTYIFDPAAGNLGTDTITEASNTATDTLDFNAFASAITVDLTLTTSQTVSAGTLSIQLSNNTAIENVIGGSGNDIITGNTRDNILSGGNGDDTLSGGTANDTLLGQEGNDTLSGGLGTDTLNGGTGDDNLSGDGGNDTYRFNISDGNLGTDTVSEAANADTDTLDLSSFITDVAIDLGLTSSQMILSGALALSLSNNTGIENVTTGTGNDTLIGNSRNNVLTGNGGADSLEGKAGNDTLVGGSGNDTYKFDPSIGNLGGDTIIESANLDTDTLDFSSFSTGITVNLGTASPQIVSIGILGLTLSHASGLENVIGGSGNDIITGNGRDNILTGGFGNDTLSGSTGHDTLRGEAGNDTLLGGTGNDTLDGGTGDDSLIGESGSDRFLFNAADGNLGTDTITEAANLDVDTLDFSSFTTDVTVDLSSTANQTVSSGVLVLTLSIGTAIENIIGGAGNDTLIGNSRDNTLTGGAGNDALVGGAGNDTYRFDPSVGNLGTDTLTESTNSGTDTLDFSPFTTGVVVDLGSTATQTVSSGILSLTLSSTHFDNLTGGSGDDTLIGNNGNNALIGNAGNDTLIGLGANDKLTGGAGDDSLQGGTGIDNFYFSGSTSLGSDTIVENANEGVDIVDMTGLGSGATLDLGSTALQTVNSLLNITLSSAVGIETLIGTNLDDVLTGNTLVNIITGNGGNDIINGGDANDQLDGGAGNDTINGGGGNDQLVGSGGDDTLAGGTGNDLYLYTGTSNLGSDIIDEKTNEGTDTVDLSRAIGTAALNVHSGLAQALSGNLAIQVKDGNNLEYATPSAAGDSGNNTFTVQGETGAKVAVEFVYLDSLASYHNKVYVYTNGDLNTADLLFTSNSSPIGTKVNRTYAAGTVFSIYIAQNGGPQNFFTDPASNPGSQDHVRTTVSSDGEVVYNWEDLSQYQANPNNQTYDGDYNDVVLSVKTVTIIVPPKPESDCPCSCAEDTSSNSADGSSSTGDGQSSYQGRNPASQGIQSSHTLPNISSMSGLATIKATPSIGNTVGNAYYYDPSGLNSGDKVWLNALVDASSESSGTKDWKFDLEYLDSSGNVILRESVKGLVVLDNRSDSVFGNGWNRNDLDRLIISGDYATLLAGNGSAVLLNRQGATYQTLSADSNDLKLTQVGSNYRLADKFGDVKLFNSAGRMLSHSTATGLTTTYTYVSGQPDLLETVTKPNGDVTRYTYESYAGTKWRVATIVEHDQSINPVTTDYNYNSSSDNLLTQTVRTTSDIVPVIKTVSFAYNSTTKLLTEITDSEGNSSTINYDFAGRVSSIERACGGTTALQAHRSLGLVDRAVIGNSLSNKASLTKVNDTTAVAYAEDERGNPRWFKMNELGQTTWEKDAQGNETSFIYDGNGNMLSMVAPDPDGASALEAVETLYTYDSKGNRLTQTQRTAVTQTILATQSWTYDATFGAVTSSTDELGRVTKYVIGALGGNINDDGRILSETRIVGLDDTTSSETDDVTTTYTYGSVAYASLVVNGLMTSTTDANGHTTTYQYYNNVAPSTGKLGLLQKITNPDSTFRTYDYDTHGNRTSTTDELARITTYVYDGENRLISRIDADPDGAGPLAAPIWSYEYDTNDNQTKIVDPLGRETIMVYNNRTWLAQKIEEGGVTTSYTYNCVGDMKTMTDPLGRVTTYAYNSLNQRTTVTQPDPDGAGPLTSPVTSTTYDALGRTKTTTDANGNVTTYGYDQRGNQTTVTMADPDGAGPLAASVSTSVYDAAGQILSSIDPLGRTTTYGYDDLGRQISVTMPDPDGSGPLATPVMTTTYDKVGNILTSTDALGHVTSYAYDDRDRTMSVTNPNLEVTEYTYDLVGNRLSLTDPNGNTTEWEFDDLNRVVSETNELNKTRTFAYDISSRLILKTDRLARETEYVYDDLDRLIEEKWDSVTAYTWSYDAAGQLLTGGSIATREYVYTYDHLGRVTQIDTNEFGSYSVYDLNWMYDSAGNVLSRTHAANSATWTYDKLNRATSVSATGTVGTYGATFTYNSASQLIEQRHSDTSVNSGTPFSLSEFGYDQAGKLNNIAHRDAANNVFASYGYTWDAADRITAVDFLNGSYDNEDALYSLDYEGQVTGADRTGSTTDESYTYNNNGNRTAVTRDGASSTWGVGTNNRLTSDGTNSYTYDDEGNLTGDGTNTYYWDHRNRLIEVRTGTTGVMFMYDSNNLRVGKIQDLNGDWDYSDTAELDTQTSYYFDGNRLVREVSLDTTVENNYLFGMNGQLIAVEDKAADRVDFAYNDHLGSVRDVVVVDAGTAVHTEHNNYDSFGRLVQRQQFDGTTWNIVTSQSIVSIGYTSEYFDITIGAQYNEQRWYRADLGIWLSEDPIGFEAGDTNLKRYVGNKSVVVNDPSGLAWWWPGDWFKPAAPAAPQNPINVGPFGPGKLGPAAKATVDAAKIFAKFGSKRLQCEALWKAVQGAQGQYKQELAKIYSTYCFAVPGNHGCIQRNQNYFV